MYADDMTLSYAHDYSNAPQTIVVELQILLVQQIGQGVIIWL